jgi:hypothetical protein
MQHDSGWGHAAWLAPGLDNSCRVAHMPPLTGYDDEVHPTINKKEVQPPLIREGCADLLAASVQIS